MLAFILMLLLILTSFTLLPCRIAASEEMYTPTALSFKVYSGGAVLVEYGVIVDQTYPSVNITLFGDVIENLLVVDGLGLPLDHSFLNGSLSVYSLGAEEVVITYLTQDLTEKVGRYWTLSLNTSMDSLITLPIEGHIVSLNKVPEVIESFGSQIQLVMSEGLIEVTYVIGVVGTKEYARIVLNEAERIIMQIKGFGINITSAEIKLQEAQQLFDFGNYGQAESLGYEARSLAIQINQTASQAITEIESAEKAITEAEEEGRPIGLNEARSLLSQADAAYLIGDYEQALSLAIQAKEKADEASSEFPFYQVVGVLVAVLSCTIILFYKLRERAEDASLDIEAEKVDVERIFKRYDLREEEKQAITLLAERGGRVFEAEIYAELGLPRTSTWRMVRRLAGMGIVEVRKFREQNLVCVRKRYIIKN
jgi:uncharacterized membrane protein